jgi:hypothetical protein
MPGGILDEGAPAVLEVPEPAHPLKTRAIAARAEREEMDFIIRRVNSINRQVFCKAKNFSRSSFPVDS